MNNQKITILYERLSVEDDRETESNSIVNQRALLQEYAAEVVRRIYDLTVAGKTAFEGFRLSPL